MEPAVKPTTFSIPGAAAYVGIPAETMRWWLKQGRLPRIKVGRRVLVRKSDLDKLIAESLERRDG